MTESERRLDDDRANRRAARGLFESRLAQVKADYAARSIPQRIKAKAVDESAKALDQGIAIASESKGIIAGTFAALLLWLFRAPVLAFGRRLFAAGQDPVQDDDGTAPLETQEQEQ